MRMKDKVAIVTGAASGLGREIARAFSREGAKVCIADLQLEAAKATAADIDRAGGSTIAVKMDVTDEQQVEAGVSATIERFGGVDVLVSNAGYQYISPLVDLTLDNWRNLLATHLDGAFLTTRACLRHMYKARRGGSIIYMGSVHSLEASPLKAPYVAAKHGLLGLCRVVAKEAAAAGVRANIICPGFVRTPLVEKQIPDTMAARKMTREQVINDVLLLAQPTKQFVTVEEIASLALYLAGDMARSITGSIISIDGGWTAA